MLRGVFWSWKVEALSKQAVASDTDRGDGQWSRSVGSRVEHSLLDKYGHLTVDRFALALCV